MLNSMKFLYIFLPLVTTIQIEIYEIYSPPTPRKLSHGSTPSPTTLKGIYYYNPYPEFHINEMRPYALSFVSGLFH